MPVKFWQTIIRFWFELKGQIKPKADCRAIDSHKKWINEFVLFAFLLSQQTKQIHSFVFGRIYSAPILLSVLSDIYLSNYYWYGYARFHIFFYKNIDFYWIIFPPFRIQTFKLKPPHAFWTKFRNSGYSGNC